MRQQSQRLNRGVRNLALADRVRELAVEKDTSSFSRLEENVAAVGERYRPEMLEMTDR
jgi:hypothetical protein